jgi:hypothetical protein
LSRDDADDLVDQVGSDRDGDHALEGGDLPTSGVDGELQRSHSLYGEDDGHDAERDADGGAGAGSRPLDRTGSCAPNPILLRPFSEGRTRTDGSSKAGRTNRRPGHEPSGLVLGWTNQALSLPVGLGGGPCPRKVGVLAHDNEGVELAGGALPSASLPGGNAYWQRI